MKFTELLKTTTIITGLSTPIANATDHVKQECSELIYDKNSNCKQEGNRTICDIKNVHIENGKGKVGDFDFILKEGFAEVSSGNESYTYNQVKNNGNGNCEIVENNKCNSLKINKRYVTIDKNGKGKIGYYKIEILHGEIKIYENKPNSEPIYYTLKHLENGNGKCTLGYEIKK